MTLFARTGLLALTLGTCAGLALAPSSASALSCSSHHSEELSVELASAELDGETLLLETVELDGDWIRRVRTSPLGTLQLNDLDYERWASFEMDMSIEPSTAVADYIESSERRTTRGTLCSGLPFVAVKPGIYLADDTEPDISGDATVTLDAAREQLVLEYAAAEGDYTLRYEVVDFFFDEDRRGGCSVQDANEPGPAGLAFGLGLLGLCAWRRRTQAATATEKLSAVA